MSARTYKKYMKKNAPKEYSLLKLFILSFFGMLLIFTFLIKSFTPTVDVSIGEYKQEPEVGGFPGGPGDKTPRFYHKRHGFDPWSGNSDPTCQRVHQP